jgi:hypothetical protein
MYVFQKTVKLSAFPGKTMLFKTKSLCSQESCHPQASVNETTDRLGWTATVQMPEPVQRLLKDRKKSDEANYSDF